MNVSKVKLFVVVCVLYAGEKHLDLENQELICLYEECLVLALILKDIPITKTIHLYLGICYQSLNCFEEAVKVRLKYLNLVINDCPKVVGNACRNLGNSYLSLGKYNEAIEHYKIDLDIAVIVNNKQLEASSYGNLGVALFLLARYKEAKDYCEKHLAIAIEIRDKGEEGSAYIKLGYVYEALYKHNDAIECYTKSRDIAKKIGDKDLEWKTYSNLGNIYNLLGKFKEAIHCHEKGLNVSIQIDDQHGEAVCYGNLGLTIDSLGEFRKAIEYQEKGLKIFQQTKDRNGEARTYINLGISFTSLQEYHKAIECCEKGLNLHIEIGNRKGEAKACSNLGIALHSIGENHKAIAYLLRSLNISKDIGDRRNEGKTYANLGIAKYVLGKYLEAIAYHKMSLNIAIEIDDRYVEGWAYGNLCTDYLGLFNFREAIKCNEKHLSIAQEIGDRSGECDAYIILGRINADSKQYNDAITNLEKARDIAKDIGKRNLEGQAYQMLGDIYCIRKEYDKAFEYYEIQLDMVVKTGYRNGEGECYKGLGYFYHSLGEYNNAVKYFKKCLEIAKEISDKKLEAKANFFIGRCYYMLSYHNKVKQDQENHLFYIKMAENSWKESLLCYDRLFDDLKEHDQFKISIVDQFVLAYRLLTMLYIETERLQEALVVTERGRSRSLGDILVSKYLKFQDPGTKPLLGYSDIAKIVDNQDSSILLFELDQEHGHVATWVLSNQNPLFFVYSKFKGFVSSTDNLVKSMTWNQDISKVLNKAHSYMQVRRGVNCEDRSSDQKDNVRCAFDEKEFDINPLEELFDMLVAPIQHCLKLEEVVIIPEGSIFEVPFAALRDPKTDLYLSENVRLRFAPSLTTLNVLQESPVDYHCKSGALIVGSPNIGEVLFRGNKKTFAHLKFAKQEVEEISKLLGVEALTGDKATKEVVKQKLQEGVAVIHFAAHGSEIGEIILAPTISTKQQSTPVEDDYILTVREAQEIGIRSQLVVLSCCHSGRGEIKPEGVIGMSRAFIAAGARSVLASLWAIDDEATKVFMLKFYSHLKKGESASESLHQAMKEMREKGQYTEPKYWAPFILIGDNVTVSL